MTRWKKSIMEMIVPGQVIHISLGRVWTVVLQVENPQLGTENQVEREE